MKALCMIHNLEFPDEVSYRLHKNQTHGNSSLPPGVSPEMLPSKEFIDIVKNIESKKEVVPQQPVELVPTTVETPAGSVTIPLPKNPATTPLMPSQQEIKQEVITPLRLTYQYVGICPEHKMPVETLGFHVLESYVISAYCMTGKHKITEKIVPELDDTKDAQKRNRSKNSLHKSDGDIQGIRVAENARTRPHGRYKKDVKRTSGISQ